MRNIFIAAIIAVGLAACSKQDVSFETLETAKNQARENSLFNGQKFRAENPAVNDWTVVSNGDSSQTNACPQGDGWATLTFYSPDKAKSIKVKCSTVSAATGCLFDAEFKGKPFASDDGRCSPNSPHPLPKIGH